MKTHKDLDSWKNALQLVTKIYKLTKEFPKEELYALTSQIRRSAISVPSNIAEGAARQYNKEFIQFLHIAQGSLSELETQLLISINLEYISENECNTIQSHINLLRAQLSGLIKYCNTKTSK